VYKVLRFFCRLAHARKRPVIPVNTVVHKKRIIRKNKSAKEEERQKGSLTPPPTKNSENIYRELRGYST
jgi:hypothetical protein